MPFIDSPLRYPGGKSQLAPFVVDVLRANDLFNGVYAEPFAGGAGIACNLLVNGLVSEVWINDIDPALYAFWASVLRHTDELCERIERTPVTMEQWRMQKAVQAVNRPRVLDLGFSAFFLNRTNRSGILKGGVIGGFDQKGKYALDCRFNRPDLIARIRRIALYAGQVRLTRLDAGEFIRDRVPRLPERSLVNIDPPYFQRGPELYTSFYRADDHAALATDVRAIGRPWMLTYDNAAEIRQLYAGLPMFWKKLNYFAQVKRVGVELLVLAPTLKMPDSIDGLTADAA